MDEELKDTNEEPTAPASLDDFQRKQAVMPDEVTKGGMYVVVIYDGATVSGHAVVTVEDILEDPRFKPFKSFSMDFEARNNGQGEPGALNFQLLSAGAYMMYPYDGEFNEDFEALYDFNQNIYDMFTAKRGSGKA